MTTQSGELVAPVPAPADRPSPLDRYAAPLREAPAWERALRIGLAIVLVVLAALYVASRLDSATLVERGGEIYAPLLNDIADGKVRAIDDTRDDYLLWRAAEGGTTRVYAERRYDIVNLRATIDAQPFVEANPGAIRYERIDAVIRDDRDDSTRGLDALLVLTVIALVTFGPEPRRINRWGWYWVALSGVGLVAYLMLSGSYVRTEDAEPPPDRLRGRDVFLLAITSWILLAFASNALIDARERPGGVPGAGTARLVTRS